MPLVLNGHVYWDGHSRPWSSWAVAPLGDFWNYIHPPPRSCGGRGSRVVWVSDRGWLCHEFEPITGKDPPCRAEMHAKSIES
ncbi:hypothetical protein TNCV_5101881 [Trichonephila clavipes]|nr:hypothetical protein TNCV_5101881 [Trichonephila clavipes]